MLQVLFFTDELFRFMRIFYPTEHMTGVIRAYHKIANFEPPLHASLHH